MSSSAGVDEVQIMDFIRKTTMVGLLPVPHPIGTVQCNTVKCSTVQYSAIQ